MSLSIQLDGYPQLRPFYTNMDIIRSSLTFTQTIKNVSRFRESVAVFAKNGFDEFMIQSGLHPYMPGAFLSKARINRAMNEFSGDSWAGKLGYRLRRCFESLGPSFVKIGQFLSTREDIFPSNFIEEMKQLQDQVQDREPQDQPPNLSISHRDLSQL